MKDVGGNTTTPMFALEKDKVSYKVEVLLKVYILLCFLF